MSGALAPSSGRPTPLWALAAASYLARYSRNTLRSYTDSLRLLFTWCTEHGLDPLDAKRVHLELFVRYLEHERRNIPRSVAHHLTPVFGYYRFAVVDDYVKADPTVLLRRPKVYIDESRQLALDKGELQRLLEAARPNPTELALVALMALLGLRVSEAIGARLEDLGMIIRGQPTLRIVGKGGKPATIPLPRKVHDMLVAAVGARTHGPIVIRPPRGSYLNGPGHAMLRRSCSCASARRPASTSTSRRTASGTPS